MDPAKSWLHSKTLWFNVISIGLTLLGMPETLNLIPASLMPFVPVAIAAGNMYLRGKTTQPLALVTPKTARARSRNRWA